MSRTFMRLQWSVVVEDSDHWSQEELDAAHADTDSHSYDSYAVKGLADAMVAAGEAFIAQHPTMFDGGIV